MKSSPHPIPTLAAAITAGILLSASASIALEGDNLADRIVLPSNVVSPISGTTVGMTRESGETNETGGPASADNDSVWYEWTPPETGAAFMKMSFPGSSSYYRTPPRGIA